jgi:hypothetical protein
MSTGLIVTPNNAIKARSPIKVNVSDGTIAFPYGHPEYFSRNQPDGMLLLDLQNNEYSEFRLDVDRDCDITLYNHSNGSRYKLIVYRTTIEPINITINNKTETYVVPGAETGTRLLILDVEVAELDGVLVEKIGPTTEKIQEILGQLNTSSIRVSEDIQFNGVEQGAYSDGSIILKNTSLTEVLKMFAQKSLPVTYTQPVFGIMPNSQSVESGSFVSPIIVPSFSKNDAGEVTSYVLKRNGDIVLNVAALANYQQDSIQVADGASVSFDATVNYSEGSTKLNNMGEPVPAGKILAGSKSDFLKFTGVRCAFFGAKAGVFPETADDIRSFLTMVMSPVNGTSFTISIPEGANWVMFAYPSILRDVSSVQYLELGNAEVGDIFTKKIQLVPGANNFNPLSYKVYLYAPSVPFNSNAKYIVKI